MMLTLGMDGFSYEDLHSALGLARLHQAFLMELGMADPALAGRFEGLRTGQAFSKVDEANVLIEVGRHVGRFVARLFGAQAEHKGLLLRAQGEEILFRFRREFVKWRSAKRKDVTLSPTEIFSLEKELAEGHIPVTDERSLAEYVMGLVDRETELRKSGTDEAARSALVATLERIDFYLAARLQAKDRRGWVSLEQPRTLEFDHLVHIRRTRPDLPEQLEGPAETQRARDGFKLTDARMSAREVAGQVEYCVYCHDREKDSCSKGMRDKATGSYKKNPIGAVLAGCPLDERISEAHVLMKGGDAIAALAMICIDNPMLPGTGHRICNDCMKACIYQKQEPVNIPQIETRVLTDCLALPYGFEMYSLLTRWNPLRVDRPYPLPYRGKNIAVVGMGPAGYTLAHHLLNEGFGVIGIDGLKIEPLPPELMAKAPIRNIADHFSPLDERLLSGFGGVSEYGITVRWDKNFLQIIYLNLARRETFRTYGGVRFGGTLELDDLWRLGISHVAIAAGAGRPTIVEMKNNLLRGVRKASDFLMALQLSGAFKRDSLANMQVRLPALVIGGGLTAIDTATELAAYYPVQVEKTLDRYEALVASLGEDAVHMVYGPEERHILAELLDHGRAVRAERQAAQAAHRSPNFSPLIAKWGGVSLVYRKGLEDSPAYRLNHEEVEKCLEEGIQFLETLSPKEAIADEHGSIASLVCEGPGGKLVTLPARTLLVAAGTSPNTVYEKEHGGTFALDARRQFFLAHRLEDGRLVPDPKGFFTSYGADGKSEGRYVTFFGDNHPTYAGSVVKAMASAKDGYPRIAELFGPPSEGSLAEWQKFVERLDRELRARVVEVRRLTPTIVEVIVSAPQAARKFQPGMFYRLQNFESHAARLGNTRLVMEGTALTGAWVDPEKGLLSLIVLEMGTSSRLCALLKPGEEVVVMGPTGTPTEIPDGETVVLCGGGLGNAVLFSIARALRSHGCKVVYFAGYKKAEDLFKQDEIEAATDQIVWSVDKGPTISPRRAQDLTFQGNIVEAMRNYAEGKLGSALFSLKSARRLIAIGSDRMMAAVGKARHAVLAPHLDPGHTAIGSINSPMQCMMKEICAQCLQRHVDPSSGKEQFVFSCFNQDQLLDHVDFDHLNQRLRQNTVAEKLSNLWLDRLLSEAGTAKPSIGM